MRAGFLRMVLPVALMATTGGTATGQTTPIDVEVGYRFLDLTGSNEMYRTQVNERHGFLVRSMNLLTEGPKGVTDRIRLDVSDLGAGPGGALRLETGKGEAWALRLTWRRAEQFSALPGFANPLLATGTVPGQHIVNRVRNMVDAELEVLPGKAITPLLGYSWNQLVGPGQTTYTVGQDEFRLGQDLASTEQELRVGVAFRSGPVSGRIVQGWRKLSEHETLYLATGAGPGNNSFSYFDVNPSLTSFQRSGETTMNSPVTNALVRGELGPVRLLGSYVRANAGTDSGESEALSGSLVSYGLNRFFKGLTETTSSRADLRYWKGTVRAEATILSYADVTAGYGQRHRELDGRDLVESLYTETTLFSGFDKKDVQTLLEARTAIERTEKTVDGTLILRPITGLTLRGGASQTKEELTVVADLAEIVVPGSQGGVFERTVKGIFGGVLYTVRPLGLTVGGDVRRDRSDDPVTRMDYTQRTRSRMRIAWGLKDRVTVSGSFAQTDVENDQPTVLYGSRMREVGGGVEGVPLKGVSLRLMGSRYTVDSTARARVPHDFTDFVSAHAENGLSWEGGLTLSLFDPFTLDASYLWFDNKGTVPFTLERIRARGDVWLSKSVGTAFEWSRDRYTEGVNLYGSYVANRYGIFLKLRQ